MAFFMHRFLTCCLLALCFTSSAFSNEIMLEDLNGTSIPLTSLKGKWVYINYWASWCGPCLHEIPELNRFYEHHKTENIAFCGVNYDGLPLHEQVKLIRKIKLRYPSLADDPKDVLRLGDIQGVPVTFIFNPEGKLHDICYGAQTEKSLSAYITQT